MIPTITPQPQRLNLTITPQHAFNAAWQAFVIEDKRPARSVGGGCCYLTSDGAKCAIGLCIPDGHRMLDEAGGICRDFRERYPELFGGLSDSEMALLQSIQCSLHDNMSIGTSGSAESPPRWLDEYAAREARAKRYREFAAFYKLTVPGGEKANELERQLDQSYGLDGWGSS